MIWNDAVVKQINSTFSKATLNVENGHVLFQTGVNILPKST